MNHTQIKNLLASAINSVSSSVSDYVVNPGKDFSRNRKLPADKLISFLIAEGSSTTKNELLDFFGMSGQSPTSSAFFQQRTKLKPEALKDVFDAFTGAVPVGAARYPGYRLIAADGSTASYFSTDKYSLPEEYLHLQETPSRGRTASISMPSRTWTHICIPTLCCSRFTARTSFAPSAPLWTDTSLRPARKTSTSATGAIALITTWPTLLKTNSTFCLEPRM